MLSSRLRYPTAPHDCLKHIALANHHSSSMSPEHPSCAEEYGALVARTGAEVSAPGFLAGSVVIDNCLSRVLVATYLLTGCAASAETHMPHSLQQWDGCLPWKAIARAIAQACPDSKPSPVEAPALQPEMLRVLRLPSPLRQCFVLRVLMAMPGQYCARLLRIEAAQVDVNTHLAARELASMAASAAPLARGTYS